MSEDYYTYTDQLMPEGRRVFALVKACELADDRTPAEAILAKAAAFESWLRGAAGPAKPEASAGVRPKLAALHHG